MMDYLLLPPAYDELGRAAEGYDDRQVGLGSAFLDEYDAAVVRLTADPDSWPIVDRHAGIRRCPMRRFPFDILFRPEATLNPRVTIVAVAHHLRRPGYWRDRLS